MLIDPPSYAAPIEEWRRYLDELKKMPRDDQVRAAIKEAEDWISAASK